MSAGPEIVASTARGAMLYDASRCSQPGEWIFDRAAWRVRGALEETAGGRGSIAFIHDDAHRWALRHYQRGGLVARLLDDSYLYTGAARTRAFREWRLLRQLQEWQLPVPAPVAARYVRSGFVYRADLLTEELPTRRTLAHAIAAASLGADQWQRVGACIGSLHARGVHHADLNAHNLLVAQDGAVYVLDFDRGRVRARGPWEQAVLARLKRSLLKVSNGLPQGRFDEAAWSALLKGCEDT